ncbi:MAG: hypothetical protein K6G31_09380 [Paludibacteraceae bacterium]|nr:hypothetical protein [Paludibacteraceae bacterium]
MKEKVRLIRVLHVILCLLVLIIVPSVLYSIFTPEKAGGSDGGAMKALGILMGWAGELATALLGLIAVHSSKPKSLILPTMLTMAIASAAMFISEVKLYIVLTYAMLPIYGLISWWVDKKIGKYQAE